MRLAILLTGITALLVATGILRLAQATERYSVRCKGQLFTVYGHHGYEFFSGEPKYSDEKKALPNRLFRFGDGGALYFRGRKCKYVRQLSDVGSRADSKRSISDPNPPEPWDEG